MVTSSQMAAPLLTTECVTSGEASVRASADEPGTGSVRGLYGFYLDVCSNSNAAGFKQNFCESNDLSPYLSNGKTRLRAHAVQLLVTVILCVPPMPKAFPLPKGKNSLREGCSCQRKGRQPRLWEQESRGHRYSQNLWLKRTQMQLRSWIEETHLSCNGQPFQLSSRTGNQD